MILIDKIINFLTDGDKKITARFTLFVFSAIIILLFDNITGFSHYYKRQRQLDQLSSITLILKDSTLTKTTRNSLIELQEQTFKRKNIFDYLSSFLKNIDSIDSNTIQNNTNKNSKSIKNNLWYFLSTSGIYILMTIFVVPAVFITNKKTPFLKLLLAMIIFVLIMFTSSLFNYWALSRLISFPILNNWTWNYLLNLALQIILFFGVIFMVRTVEKTDASS